MTVYIVLCHGKVDQVFNTLEAAELHRDNLVRQWNLTDILERTVNMI